jgi:adenine/guanine phosphoribosyltransferase-like PRPP-binding protein
MHFACHLGGRAHLEYVIQTPSSTDYLAKIPSGSRVLLVSDIVLTGSTANALLDEIEQAGSEVVGLMTLLGLSNSVCSLKNNAPVAALCTLARPFYTEGECPLCRVQYPRTTVTELSAFRQMPATIRPYDFWEAVLETKAFSAKHHMDRGRHYTYFINIEKLCSMYGDCIARQLLHQLSPVLKLVRPKVVVYPESNASRLLADAVARRLAIRRIIALPREYLNSFPNTGQLLLPQELASLREQPVLVVDDGCNTLRTISAVENLLLRLHSTPIGYLVVLNRASSELTSKKVVTSNGTFQYYYHWPVAVYANGDVCPECIAMRSQY